MNKLHHNLMMLRHSSLPSFSAMQFSTTAAAPKILYEQHTAALHEIKLNAPKVLNAVDTEMVNLMISRVK